MHIVYSPPTLSSDALLDRSAHSALAPVARLAMTNPAERDGMHVAHVPASVLLQSLVYMLGRSARILPP